MRRFIIILLVFIISIVFGLKIAQDPGYAFFSYQQWSMEMPLWFAIVALVLLFFIFTFVLKFFDNVDFSLYRWKTWLRFRRQHQFYSKTNRGLIELIEGDWKKAEGFLLEGIQQSDASLINYLAAAKAANERGAYDKRDNYLHKAHERMPQAEVAVGLTQAHLQFKQGQLEQALATLKKLQRVAPKQKMVLKMLERIYVHLGDWCALLVLLPSLRKSKLIDQAQQINFEKKIYSELLVSANKSQDRSKLQSLWDTVPRSLQQEPELVCCYVKQLRAYPDAENSVVLLLTKTIKKHWNKELIELYGRMAVASSAKSLTTALASAEGWLKEHTHDALLLLTLARLSMRCQLWGKARTYYEASLKTTPTLAGYLEYGKLLEQLGEQVAATESYRQGLLFAAGS